ncbi:taurine transport system substrate-binding protein [Limimaricola soesokkakensis]|uniref:Taurine transport system substrate-binding protein n=1 Tax=Limimaricola soesokkakensis TaxID=1343159 RepID=A0A1X6ZB84_9RHOB|nr:ABC transporter substrate-binding protein [Limimaricola soesokkakensis]PSK86410.1 taurine transport system substrate-binding protein [Limimaricola soesokkakensis]SLN46406.1 Taurine-binding periplasmic protein precursor [Limimaricola soesokkakensis]
MTRKSTLPILALTGLLAGTAASAQDGLTVAYFPEWPMPFQYAKAEGLYDEKLGLPVNWVRFDSGTAMSAAMAAGNVQIAISQGVLPFIGAASAGQDLRIVDIAASYADNENCVVAAALEIDAENAKELEGLRVAVPVGTGAQYTFLQLMEHFEVDTSTMSIVDMAPAEGAAAFSRGDVDMACGWGGALARMMDYGNVLLTGPEKEEIGILSFDLTTTSAEFAAARPELLADFLELTAEMNAKWNAGADRAEMLPVIARDAGMEEGPAGEVIDDFTFIPVDTLLSEKWLGGRVGSYIDGAAEFFHAHGTVPSILPGYGELIITAPLQDIGTN